MLSVHQRGFEPNDRSVAGHWEGDLIVGPHHRSAIGTLVERQTRYVKLLHLPASNSIEMHAALVRALGQLPPPLRRTLTWDQGTEMAKHLDVTADTGTQIYFCDATSPWQRGSNENTNGLLRQYFPKSTDLSVHSPRDLARVERELNQRPRITLNDRTPHELFEALLASENHPSCDDCWNPSRHNGLLLSVVDSPTSIALARQESAHSIERKPASCEEEHQTKNGERTHTADSERDERVAEKRTGKHRWYCGSSAGNENSEQNRPDAEANTGTHSHLDRRHDRIKANRHCRRDRGADDTPQWHKSQKQSDTDCQYYHLVDCRPSTPATHQEQRLHIARSC